MLRGLFGRPQPVYVAPPPMYYPQPQYYHHHYPRFGAPMMMRPAPYRRW